ncbi:MAG TPA: TRAM domain-containing protein [Geopsychrobacteraceae bacterium]|nr:TRAM domain-containing protein [Geopsychrobacteraceae bacterium]
MSRLTGPLKIEALAYGGKGIARFDGKVIFVTGAVPGDLAICRLTKEKKRYAEAELVECVAASRLRRNPPCPVFDRCGGCQWQGLEYAEQCRWKETIFRDLLQRQAGINAESILSIVQAPDEWNYRSRIQFKCAQQQGRFLAGFYRTGSHSVVDIDSCPVAAPELNAIFDSLKSGLADSPFSALVSQIDMAVGDDSQVRVVIHTSQESQAFADFCRPFAEESGFGLFLQSDRSRGPQHLCGPIDLRINVDLPPFSLSYGPGGFSQINRAQNRNLVAAVVDSLQLNGSESVLDLYCGMGNFSLPLARRSRSVTAVEEYAPSIVKGRENAVNSDIENISFECSPAEGYLSSVTENIHFDVVLLDPPRSGARRVVDELLSHRPGKIAYVSCDPATLARDLDSLIRGGYRVVASRPYDMFPQTYHIESFSLLEVDT